ncbi:MAG: hypothetical protein RSA84_09365 [Acinetobacter sp.]
MSNNFEITVIDGENVVEVNNNPVEILTVGMQGPRGIQGIAGEVDPTIIENLQNQITDAQTLAQTNDLKIGTKADQVDLETAEQQIELNRLAILTKADIAALAMLSQLVDTKADQAYVNQQITTLVGSAPEALNTVYELAAAIQDNAGIIDTLNQSVANRVRFDVATQALTEIQKQNARTNIGAETLGTAATLVAAITAASIGAATAAQGTKADTALQSGDVAPVALSGLFNSLVGQNKIFDVVFGAYALGSNTAVVATDTLGQIIGKLQAQINNIAPPTWVSAASIGTVHPSLTGMEFAKINGNLWVRGRYQSANSVANGTILFTLTNAGYRIETPESGFSDLLIGQVQVNTNFIAAQYLDLLGMVNPNRYYFKLRTRGSFDQVASPSYAVIQPTPIGKLLTP